MKNLFLITAALVIAAISGGCSAGPEESVTAAASNPVAAAPDADISKALAAIEKRPDVPDGYSQLAIIYIKRARANGDFSLNSKADQAIDKALEVKPADPTARKLKAALHLTFHRFGEALTLGRELQTEYPNDDFVYGILTDANVELGNYPEAIDAAQKMIDLKPSAASYARVGHLRSLSGDHPGAVEMMRLAAKITDPQDKEAQSWGLVRLGDEYWKNGNYAQSESSYDEALTNLPNYHLALAGKGKVLSAKGDFTGAAKFLSDARDRVPNPETIILLGDVYTRLNESEKAKQQYDLVEVVEKQFGMDGDRGRLALFWADRNEKLDEALAIAEGEYTARKDIYTTDIYAWCLYRKGRLEEAKKIIGQAMRLNTDDARILYHAGMIEKDSGNPAGAAKLFGKALELNPAFDLIQTENARLTSINSK